MAEALAEVRRHLGADAVILHTRSYKRGGLMGIGARAVVEVTAADGRELGKHRQEQARRERSRLRARTTAARPSVAPTATATPVIATAEASGDWSGQPLAGDLIRRTYAAARAEMNREHAAAPVAVAAPPAPAPAPQPAPDHLAEEMRAVKRMVARMMDQQKQRTAAAPGNAADLPDKLFDQYLALLEQEVAEELASEIIADVRRTLSPDDLDDDKCCRKAVMAAVAKLLPTPGADEDTLQATATPRGDRPRTIALVGPTGVGKTTTVAKLAATFKLKQNLKVALITLDTYRIAAVDQLRTYANIIGVPLHVVTSPDELAQTIERCRGCDVVLIDTAGRSQRDDPRLEELARFIEAARAHEVHLVLSSTCTQKVLEDTVDRFSKIHTDRIIFTKLDEAVTFGVVLNVMRKVRKRLSYITTGQEVPHQIEPGQPDRLAALVLGEGALR